MAFRMLAASAQAQETNPAWNGFELGNTTFANNTFVPISTIHNLPMNKVNICSIDGSPGGNQSPELFWTGASPNTLTFVVSDDGESTTSPATRRDYRRTLAWEGAISVRKL